MPLQSTLNDQKEKNMVPLFLFVTYVLNICILNGYRLNVITVICLSLKSCMIYANPAFDWSVMKITKSFIWVYNDNK